MKTKPTLLILSTLGSLMLGACSSNPAMKPDATANLGPSSGSQVNGSVNFKQTAAGLQLEGVIAGLTPGEHGFHIHEVGDCSAPDGTSAKGHFNPSAAHHGHHDLADHHAGDIPNLVADASGNAKLSVTLADVHLTKDSNAVINRALVIHADPDDYKTQPAGNSGKRIACGVIKSVQ